MRLKTYHLSIQIDAKTANAADALRDDIVGAVEDSNERTSLATGIVGSLNSEPNLSERELATVLAALRLFQRTPESRLGTFDIAGYFEDCGNPLTPLQIDELCERLNTRQS